MIVNRDRETRAFADQWTGLRCWLDGEPAMVCGRLNTFATVVTMDNAKAIQFSWHTVNRIMNGTGEFKA
jgi:hypothetical protein